MWTCNKCGKRWDKFTICCQVWEHVVERKIVNEHIVVQLNNGIELDLDNEISEANESLVRAMGGFRAKYIHVARDRVRDFVEMAPDCWYIKEDGLAVKVDPPKPPQDGGAAPNLPNPPRIHIPVPIPPRLPKKRTPHLNPGLILGEYPYLRAKRHLENRTIILCRCGCGRLVSNSSKYRLGHGHNKSIYMVFLMVQRGILQESMLLDDMLPVYHAWRDNPRITIGEAIQKVETWK